MGNPAPSPTPARLSYLDNLRSFVIFLVVVMHSNVTYSGFGSWYYVEGNSGNLDVASKVVFGFYGSFTQAWFMGILFFIAAYFAARSVQRHGVAVFVRERLFRLGVPLLIYVFFVHPFIGYVLLNWNHALARGILTFYERYLVSWKWLSATGPLWFVEALLLFSLPYALWRWLRPMKPGKSSVPKTLTFIGAIVVTGIAAFAIRLVMPVGQAFANLQFPYFASYVVLFWLGIRAGEGNWLEDIPDRTGMRWFSTVLIATPPIWAALMILGGALQGRNDFSGGMNGPALGYAFWEAFVAIGFSLGLVVFFRRFLGTETPWSRFLVANSFAVYVFHPPVLIAISLLLKDWDAAPMLKHLGVAPLAYLSSLAVAFLIRRIPGLRQVLR
jgi:surface polysaccharide O-acyltransferase-like enzyme